MICFDFGIWSVKWGQKRGTFDAFYSDFYDFNAGCMLYGSKLVWLIYLMRLLFDFFDYNTCFKLSICKFMYLSSFSVCKLMYLTVY